MTAPTVTLNGAAISLQEYADTFYDDNHTMYWITANQAALVRAAADVVKEASAFMHLKPEHPDYYRRAMLLVNALAAFDKLSGEQTWPTP